MSNWAPYQFQNIVFWCSVPIWDRVIITLLMWPRRAPRVHQPTHNHPSHSPAQHIVVSLWLWLWISASNTHIYVVRYRKPDIKVMTNFVGRVVDGVCSKFCGNTNLFGDEGIYFNNPMLRHSPKNFSHRLCPVEWLEISFTWAFGSAIQSK